MAALERPRLIGRVDLGFLLLLLVLAYSCWLKIVGGGENEGVLVGECEKDKRKAVSLCLVWI